MDQLTSLVADAVVEAIEGISEDIGCYKHGLDCDLINVYRILKNAVPYPDGTNGTCRESFMYIEFGISRLLISPKLITLDFGDPDFLEKLVAIVKRREYEEYGYLR